MVSRDMNSWLMKVVRALRAVFQKIVTLTVDSASRQKKMYVDYKPCFVVLTVDVNENICFNTAC